MVLAQRESTKAVQERIRRSAYATFEGGLYKLAFHAMSTICRVQFQAPNERGAREFQSQVLDWVGWFEARYSRFLPDSLISQINAAAGCEWVEVDPETDALLNLCQEMVFFTRGVFDPTALPLIRLWNWKAKPPMVPAAEAVANARELVGWHRVHRSRCRRIARQLRRGLRRDRYCNALHGQRHSWHTLQPATDHKRSDGTFLEREYRGSGLSRLPPDARTLADEFQWENSRYSYLGWRFQHNH